MKRMLIAVLVALASMAASGASFDDQVAQGQAKYTDGDTVEAMRLFGNAYATNPTAAAQKRVLADAYTDVGVQEYDRKNWKNAYECFKNALKLAPTNQTASKYFWKMKGEMDVDRLKNEGPTTVAEVKAWLAAKSGGAAGAAAGGQAGAGAQAGTGAAAAAGTTAGVAGAAAAAGGVATTGGAATVAAPPGIDPAEYKAALEKLAKAEQDLASLRTASATVQSENASLKADLERQRQEAARELDAMRAAAASTSKELEAVRTTATSTSKELEQLRQTASTAATESASLKTELQRQQQSAAAELERIRTASDQARDQNASLQVELARQKEQIDALRQRMASTPQPSAQDTKALQDMLTIYQQTLDKQSNTGTEVARLMADQIAAQRSLMEQQFQALSGRNWILVGAFALLALIVLALVVLIVRAQLRRRRAGPVAASELFSPAVTPALLAAQAASERGPQEPQLLLGATPAEGGAAAGAETRAERSMYGDILRAERIRRMHDQMKQGTLRWETVREYTGELEKDLRAEILKVVEAKLQQGDSVDPRSLFPVLWPFLTDYDDFLRQKAESLIRRSMAGGVAARGLPALAALPAQASAGGAEEGEEGPLGMSKLLEIPDRLTKVLKDREKSLVTAKVARGVAGILGLSAADADMLYRAAIAHDAGYLVLDRDKLQRILARQEISDEDHRFIESHAKSGPDYFEGVKLPKPFKDVLLYHHERNDGSGYPKGLVGSKIPLFAKLVGLAETYVALISERPYRQKLTPESALAVIGDGAGRKFDRDHIKALGELVKRSGELR